MSYFAKSRIFINNIRLTVELGISISDQSGSKVTPFVGVDKSIKNYQYVPGALPVEYTMSIVFTDEINTDLLDIFTEYAKKGVAFYLVSDELGIKNGVYIFKEYKIEIPYPKYNEVKAVIVQINTINADIPPDNDVDIVDPGYPSDIPDTDNIYTESIFNLINLSDLYFVRGLTDSNLIYLRGFLSLIGCSVGANSNIYDDGLDESIKRFLLTVNNCGHTSDAIPDTNCLTKQNLSCIYSEAIKYYTNKK